MKKQYKELIPALILALTASFMLFIYEPFVLYINNKSDFWFDIYTMFSCTIIPFFVTLVLLFCGYFVLYLIQKKSKKNIYTIFLVIGFVLFLITYIQGNYFSSKLPVLDGSPIIWSNYTTLSVISVIIFIVVTAIIIFMIKKLKYEKCIKILQYVTIGVAVMLIVSLFVTCITNMDCFGKKKYVTTATTKNINNYSSNKNLIVFLLDAIDSETAEKVFQENSEYKEIFKDFTYYPDTVGGYPFTRDTIPFILSGNWSENKLEFSAFYNEAMDNSKLLDMLKENDFNINIYDDEISYNTENAEVIKNLVFNSDVSKFKFIKQLIKYDLFKYLPYYLKQFSRIEGMDFIGTRNDTVENVFKWDDIIFANEYLNQDAKIGSKNEFKFIHLEGAHHPFDYGKDLEPVEDGTYEDKIEASFATIKKYMDYLKENNVYDNSAIIILSDHGFWFDVEVEDLLRRHNPIFYIKGINENHERKVSDEPVSFDYLQDIYRELIDGKQTDELFDNIDNSGPRRFLLYVISGYDHMVEYMQYGKSGDLSTLEATGNVFDR